MSFFRTRVQGELYSEVDKNTLERLDKLEGYPFYYGRAIVEVRDIQTSEIHEAWMYHLLDEDIIGAILIGNAMYQEVEPRGNWRKFVQGEDEGDEDDEIKAFALNSKT